MSELSTDKPADKSEFFQLAEANFQELFILSYRKGGDILHLYFRFENKEFTNYRDYFRAAVERAKLHCEIMRYRFLFCRSYITDLESEEKRMAM